MGCEQSKSTTLAVSGSRPSSTTQAVTGLAPSTPAATTTTATLEPRLLAVIVVHFNPQRYERRAVLVNECLQRLQATRQRLLAAASDPHPIQLVLQAVELTYDDDPPELQDSVLPDVTITRRQVARSGIMWSKEQLINLAVTNLAPAIQHVVWLDSDVGFETDDWAQAAYTKLEQYPLCFGQVWGTCHMLGPDGETQRTVTSFAQQYAAGKPYKDLSNRHLEYWHPGFAWMATRQALTATQGLLDRTLGSADRHMALSFLGRAAESVPQDMHPNYTARILAWQEAVQKYQIPFVVVPAVIRHYWHGSLRQRGYMARWKTLLKFQFDPDAHLVHDPATDLLQWSEDCPAGLNAAICDYFADRQEDSTDVLAEDVQVEQQQVPTEDDIAENVLCVDNAVEFDAPETVEPSAPCEDATASGASDYGAQMATAVVAQDAFATAQANNNNNDAFSFYA